MVNAQANEAYACDIVSASRRIIVISRALLLGIVRHDTLDLGAQRQTLYQSTCVAVHDLPLLRCEKGRVRVASGRGDHLL